MLAGFLGLLGKLFIKEKNGRLGVKKNYCQSKQ
jgi:hypothetical protein